MQVPKEIKVLFVTHHRELYGANFSLLQLMLELREKGVSPTVLMPHGKIQAANDLSEELDRLGIPYVETSIRIDKHRYWKKALANYILASIQWRKAYKAVRDLSFDIVHSNSSVMSTGAYIARKTWKPHVWHLREFGRDDYGLRTPFGKWFQNIIYGGHNVFIAISDNIEKHYRRFTGDQEIRRIYNGIRLIEKPAPRTPHDRVDICIVGFVRPEKGQMELLKAADELANIRGLRNFHITVVGEGEDSYIDEVKEYTASHSLSDLITLAGRRNDVPQLLSKMDIGVMASSHEAFGRVTVEYMMAGLAVVASDGGANREIIDHARTGLIYRSGNHLELADCLEKLITETQIRNALARNGRTQAETRFSSKANSDAVYALYKEILSRQ